MSCLYKIEQTQSTFTDTEKKISDYIKKHKHTVVNASAQNLANKTSTSSAAVIRFSKKLGYKGFTSLKVDLAKDIGNTEELFDTIIKDGDTFQTLIQKSYMLNMQNFKETFKMINEESLCQAVTAILKSKRIYLFGLGGSGIVCKDLQHKLTRINRVVMYQEDFHIQIAQAAYMSANDIAIAISYGGNTTEVNLAMKLAKENGTKTIAITKHAKTLLSKIVDIPLYIPIEEKELRLGAISSRFSSLMITDLLYLGVAKDNLEKTRGQIITTREIIHKIE